MSRELKRDLVAWEQNQPQNVSARRIKFYWDKSAVKWAKNFQRWRRTSFGVFEIEYFFNHTSDSNESVFLIYAYTEFRTHSKVFGKDYAVHLGNGKSSAEIIWAIPATGDGLR